jgi:hypothetical protein
VGVRYLEWSHRQTVEEKAGDNSKVSSTPTATGTKKIGFMVFVYAPEGDMPFAIDGEYFNCR